MNSSVKLLCACSLVAATSGIGLSRLRVEDQQALWLGARQLLGSPAPSPRPPAAEAAPAALPSASYGSALVPTNGRGQFEAPVEIDGMIVPMMVDTGATLVVLSFEDADRLGVRPAPSAFDQWVSTANGRAAVARATLRQVRIGSIVLRDVAALVASRRALGVSLLGMSFLGRLHSVRVEDGHLALQQ